MHATSARSTTSSAWPCSAADERNQGTINNINYETNQAVVRHGDPIKHITILTKPQENLALIMKDGKTCKSTNK